MTDRDNHYVSPSPLSCSRVTGLSWLLVSFGFGITLTVNPGKAAFPQGPVWSSASSFEEDSLSLLRSLSHCNDVQCIWGNTHKNVKMYTRGFSDKSVIAIGKILTPI